MFDFASSPLLALRTPGERRFRLFFDFVVLWVIAIAVPFLSAFVPGAAATLILGVNGLVGLINDALSEGLSGGAGSIDREAFTALTKQITESEGYRIVELFGAAWTVAAAVFVCLAVERRSLATMGIVKKGSVKRYGIGALLGVLLCTVTVLLSCLTRASSFNGWTGNANYLLILFYLLGYIIQGAAEEVLYHGLFLTTLARRMRWLPSVLVSALFFCFMHATNDGVTVLSLLNVYLFGVFLGLFVIRTGSVIGASALHAAWNFTEGQIFGCSVSGFQSPAGLFGITADASRAATNGGAFGPEGGLSATMVLMLALFAVLFLPSFGKKRQNTP